MRKKKQKIIYPLNRKMANQIRDKEYWRAACKKNYEKNKEKILEQRRKLYAEKKEELNERNLDYYYRTRETRLEKMVEYRAALKIAKELDL